MDSRFATQVRRGHGGYPPGRRRVSRSGRRRAYNYGNQSENIDYQPLLLPRTSTTPTNDDDYNNEDGSSFVTNEDEETPLLSVKEWLTNEMSRSSVTLPSEASLQAMRQRSRYNAILQNNIQRRQQHHYHKIAISRTSLSPRRGGHTNVSPVRDLSCWLFTHGFCCCRCVRTREVGILTRFGAYDTLLKPGFHCLLWPRDCIENYVSLKIHQMNITIETKTSDNVFVHVSLAVQYKVDDVYISYYTLDINPRHQIQSYVLDVIRSTIPKLTLDELFTETNELTRNVHARLETTMQNFGYIMLDTLVTHITPNKLVRVSMNEINTCKRMKDALSHRAEANKITKVKKAEGNAESYYLQGVGLAKERQAICNGIKETFLQIQDEKQNKEGNQKAAAKKLISSSLSSSKDIIEVLLLSHYMDTLTHIGASSISSRTTSSENVKTSRSDNTGTKNDYNNISKSLIIQFSPERTIQLRNQLSKYFI